jgi:peptide/nickel transport system substrate-binding protein
MFKTARSTALAVALCALVFSAAGLQAKVFKMANQGDVVSMDPYSLNESFQLSFLANIYDALVLYTKQTGVAPGLATEWKQVNPTTWRFTLRKGVTFHDGTPFNADDVVFSFARGAAESSDVKSQIASIAEVKKIDDFTIDLVTKSPFPILPETLRTFYMMSKKWCEANGAAQPVDVRKGKENAATLRTNGTGPFMTKSRAPGVKTEIVANPKYWEKVEGDVTEVIFTPIANDATRVAALISGEIDMMDPVPLQDIARVNANPNLKVMTGPELRTIFLGMDQKRDELLYSSVKGKNPFKDKRVRQAFYQAIDIEAIKTKTMRGAATPTALMVAPGAKGYPGEALNKRLPYDVEGAKKLMAEAGYPAGFEIGMNCPNDRYVNDEEICQAVAAMLARINVKVNLTAESKATYFPKILSRNTSFYLLGWTPSTTDSHDPLNAIMATPPADGKGGQGQFNLGWYSNPKLDELTLKIQSEIDQAKRNQMIAEAYKIHADDIGHLPLHQQALSWGMKKNINMVQLPVNYFYLKWTTIK